MPLVKYRIYELSARAVISYGRQQDGTYTFHLSAAETEKAISLYFVILIPIDSAAIRLSRIAITARPVLEFTKLYTINKMTRIMITPAVKLDK